MKVTLVKTVQEDLVRLSLVNNLKQKIECLKRQIEHQKVIIDTYKKSTKTTIINQQEVQIQQLNDENKRLLLVIQQLKSQNQFISKPMKNSKYMTKNNMLSSGLYRKRQVMQQQQQHNQNGDQQPKQSKKEKSKIDYEQKYYQLLTQNDKIRKQLTVLKANENLMKHKKFINQRSSILMQKSINQVDKIKQKNYQLEVELASSQQKGVQLKQRITDLEQLLEKALQINKSMKII